MSPVERTSIRSPSAQEFPNVTGAGTLRPCPGPWAIGVSCLALLLAGPSAAQEIQLFVGDANCDRTVDISDGISVLSHLFQGGSAQPCCKASMDVNHDLAVDLSDGISIFMLLFSGTKDSFVGPDGAEILAKEMGCRVYSRSDVTLPCRRQCPDYEEAPDDGPPEERVLLSGTTLYGSPAVLDDLEEALASAPGSPAILFAESEAVARSSEAIRNVQEKMGQGHPVVFLGGAEVLDKLLPPDLVPSAPGWRKETISGSMEVSLEERRVNQETWGQEREEGLAGHQAFVGIHVGAGGAVGEYHGMAEEGEFAFAARAAMEWAIEAAARPGPQEPLAPPEPQAMGEGASSAWESAGESVVWDYYNDHISVHTEFARFQLSDSQSAYDWYRVDATSQTHIRSYEASSSHCGRYVASRNLKIDCNENDDSYHEARLDDYGPTDTNDVTTTSYSLGGSLGVDSSGPGAGISAGYEKSWSSPEVDVEDSSEYSPGQYASWKEAFTGPDYSWYPSYKEPPTSARKSYQSYQSLIAEVDGGVAGSPSGVLLEAERKVKYRDDKLTCYVLVLKVDRTETTLSTSGQIRMNYWKPSTLVVNSTPSGAKIHVDGVDAGKSTNATLHGLTSGDHKVRLEKSGYKAWESTVHVGTDATRTVSATLEAQPGQIAVNSTPTGAAISLDGTSTGKTTNTTLAGVFAGTHTVSLVLAGYQGWQSSVNVPPGGAMTVNAALVALPPTKYTWGHSAAYTADSKQEVLLDVQDLGGVRDTGDSTENHKLEIYSRGNVVEYAIDYHGTYQQGEVASNGSVKIDFPHYTAFKISIARPFKGKSAWLFCKENDNKVCALFTATGSGGTGNAGTAQAAVTAASASTADSTKDTLVSVPGLGGVRDTGNSSQTRKLEIFSNGTVVEYAIRYNGNYTQGEVSSNGTATIDFPHYTAFEISIARPVQGKSAWLFCRENDNQVVALSAACGGSGTSASTGDALAKVTDSTSDALLDISTIGGVRDTGNSSESRKLEIYSNGSVVEYSIQYGATCTQGEVSANGSVKIDFPHYNSFMVEISRPLKKKMGCLFLRENDNVLIGHAVKSP